MSNNPDLTRVDIILNQPSNKSILENIPQCIIDLICDWLFIDEHVRLFRVNKRLRKMFSSPSTWRTLIFKNRQMSTLEHTRQLIYPEQFHYIRRTNVICYTDLLHEFKSSCVKLHELDLSHTNVIDISELSKLNHLSKLNLSYTDVSEISPLSVLTQLSYLDLKQTKIFDISPLSKLIHLHTLYISKTYSLTFSPLISDISALSTLIHLSKLNLNFTEINDISPLSTLTQLSELNLV